MKEGTETITVQGINSERKAKALFVIKCQGKTLSEEVRKLIEEKAEQFEKYVKE
jgi:hypothetical protein